MNGNGYFDDIFIEDDLDDSIFEDDDLDFVEMFGEYDDFDDDDDAERRRRRRRRRSRRRPSPRTGGRRSYSRPRPSAKYVTQTQLQTALERVRKDVKTNGVAIKKVNSRINTVNSRMDSQTSALKKEISERKKETASLKNNMQMATLLPLLTKKSLPATKEEGEVGGTTVPSGTKLATEGDSLSTLLPILLLGDGLGGSGSGGDSSSMLFLALALSGSL
ncbi:MAG: hypothetical protein H6657_15015 [Ardenticatenaceae bacterium]|nr:hypothetical protein [Ardenticatenaceae bacterium]